MATAARSTRPADLAPAGPATPPLAEVPDLAWTAGEWVEVQRTGLAPVIALDDYRAAPPAPRRSRGRVALWLGALAAAVALALTAGGQLADPGPAPQVAGQTVLAPGETLWDVAVTHGPQGADVRSYLAAIRELNGFTSADVPAWTVVLLPQP